MTDASLTIGASDMNGLERMVWVAEMLVQRVGVLQSFLIRTSPYVLEHGGYVEEVVDGFLVSDPTPLPLPREGSSHCCWYFVVASHL